MKRIQIDLNARDGGGHVPVNLEKMEMPAVGEWVVVYEPDDRVEAPAYVAGIELLTNRALLKVNWAEMRKY
jgi:hypothetical protein